MIATLRKRLATRAASSTPPPMPAPTPRRVRSLFISDVHLGTRGCRAEALCSFLNAHSCETLFLVGDIVDGWRLQKSWFWRQSHQEVINAVLAMAQSGTRVIYIPGNHDEALRPYTGLELAGVELHFEYVHETADGRRFLVLHGDHFDAAVRYARWLALLGDRAYDLAAYVNERLNQIRRFFGMPYWSLAGYLKRTVKNAVEYISRFEEAVAQEAVRRGLDGVICGHIHHASIRRISGVLYCNDGDWVDSATALAEAHDGRLSLITWDGEAPQLACETLLLAAA